MHGRAPLSHFPGPRTSCHQDLEGQGSGQALGRPAAGLQPEPTTPPKGRLLSNSVQRAKGSPNKGTLLCSPAPGEGCPGTDRPPEASGPSRAAARASPQPSRLRSPSLGRAVSHLATEYDTASPPLPWGLVGSGLQAQLGVVGATAPGLRPSWRYHCSQARFSLWGAGRLALLGPPESDPCLQGCLRLAQQRPPGQQGGPSARRAPHLPPSRVGPWELQEHTSLGICRSRKVSLSLPGTSSRRGEHVQWLWHLRHTLLSLTQRPRYPWLTDPQLGAGAVAADDSVPLLPVIG